MDKSQQKVVQYLQEAHASELALTRVLQSRVAMTPRGRMRNALEAHLHETRNHAQRLRGRLNELGHRANALQATLGAVQGAVGQALALGKTPIDLLRGNGGEEKVLKNAKDACATEALEIATYAAIEHLARVVDDPTTTQLALSIRRDEEAMLARLMDELPRLAEEVMRSDVQGRGSYDASTTGAADAARTAGRTAGRTARGSTSKARAATRGAGQTPGSQTGASQPWPGYDEQTAAQVRETLADADARQARTVRDYERAHRNRAGVIQAAERELTQA